MCEALRSGLLFPIMMIMVMQTMMVIKIMAMMVALMVIRIIIMINYHENILSKINIQISEHKQ